MRALKKLWTILVDLPNFLLASLNRNTGVSGLINSLREEQKKEEEQKKKKKSKKLSQVHPLVVY